MQVINFPTPYEISKENPLIIYPVGDVQLGSEGLHKQMFQRYINDGMERGAYFIGMGDYVDVASPSNRERYQWAGLYDSFRQMVEEKALEHQEQFAKLIRGTENRWLGMGEGHHYFDYDDGSTTDTRLAARFGAPFLGTSAFVQLNLQMHGNTRRRFVIETQHGVGGGGTKVAAPLNKLENFASGIEGVDLILMGHHHKRGALPLSRMRLSEGKNPHLTHRNVLLVVTGSFLRGYLEGNAKRGRAQGDYAEAAMYNPLALGGVPIVIRPVYRDGGYVPEAFAEV